MKQQLMVHLEKQKGEHQYIFSMPVGAPIGDAYDAVFEVLQELLKMAQQAAEKMKQNDQGQVVVSSSQA